MGDDFTEVITTMNPGDKRELYYALQTICDLGLDDLFPEAKGRLDQMAYDGVWYDQYITHGPA